MYIPRAIDTELRKWKEDARHKPLLIRGARQVGKSSAVRNLGQSFKYFIEVNLEKNKSLSKVFEGDLSPQRICRDLSAILSIPIVPGETLLFIDEIQISKEAISSLCFFYEDYQELHVIEAGSLLEFALKELQSFGVGRIRSLFMYPFSFNEFLLAQGLSGLLDAKRKASPDHPLIEPIHEKLIEQVRYFHLIGGMPATVSLWIETHDYLQCKMAGVIIPVTHTPANGQPLGAEANDKFRKFIFLDTALLLRLQYFEAKDILISTPADFVNKGNLAEMFVGLKLLKYDSPYEKQELYFGQREEPELQSAVDYVVVREGKILPIEVKAGRRGVMQSMHQFLKKKRRVWSAVLA